MSIEVDGIGSSGGWLDRVKTRYGFAGSADDEALTALLSGLRGQIATACGRRWGGQPVLDAARRTGVFSAIEFQRTLYLPAWPAVVHEILEGWDGDFDDATALVEGDDYSLDAEHGCILRVGCYWPAGERTIQVDWTGGYTDPDTAEAADYTAWAAATAYALDALVSSGGRFYVCTTAHTSATAFDATKFEEQFLLPADLVEAVIQQAGYAWQRRSMLGSSGASAGQGGSVSDSAGDDLLGGVRALCKPYPRMV